MAAAVAGVELAIIVGIGVAALAPTVLGGVEEAVRTHELATPATPQRKPDEPPPMLARTETSVVVLNGNGIAGAAGRMAGQVRALTYVVASVGNASHADYARTMVMYRGDHRREAERLARDLGLKRFGPLDGIRARELMGAHLAVVLGR